MYYQKVIFIRGASGRDFKYARVDPETGSRHQVPKPESGTRLTPVFWILRFTDPLSNRDWLTQLDRNRNRNRTGPDRNWTGTGPEPDCNSTVATVLLQQYCCNSIDTYFFGVVVVVGIIN